MRDGYRGARAVRIGEVSEDIASLAHHDLVAMPVQAVPYAPFAARAWELRANLAAYDASYVALAESLGAPLATLDRRIGRAPGLRCRLETPPAASA